MVIQLYNKASGCSIPFGKKHPLFLFLGYLNETAPFSEAYFQKSIEMDKVDFRIFLETIRKCTDIEELTPRIVNRLIRRIEVHKSAKVDGRKRVQLDVYFTAVGLINIPDEKQLLEMIEEIRRSA